MNNIIPEKFSAIEESVYAGFWPRFGALLLDFLIILPFSLGLSYLDGMSQQMHMIVLGPQVLLALLVNVYFVKLYGATPGKYIAGVKIIKANGQDAGWSEAFLRYFVDFCLIILGVFISHTAIMSMPDETYQALSFIERGPKLQATNPEFFKIYSYIMMAWVLSEFVVLLFNKRRRALHDFIAETVVIKSKYHEQIQDIINQDSERGTVQA